MRTNNGIGVLLLLSLATIGFTAPAGGAAEFEVVATGPLASVQNDASASDGTTAGPLPPIFDLARLQGGSFRATFRFSGVTPGPGSTAVYDLGPSSGVTTYELLDPAGAVVHRGTGPSEPVAIVSNNFGGAPFTVDQVLLGSVVNSVTGWNVPATRYSPTPEFHSVAHLDVNSYVGNGVNYLSDLAIPTDAATYLAFPTANAGRAFYAIAEFGDGDFVNRAGPYQHALTQLQYDIAALTVTPVPESGLACLLVPFLWASGMRRHSRARTSGAR